MINYGPLIKYGLMVAAFVGFCLSLVWYGESLKQQEWDAAVTAQAERTAAQIIAESVNTANIESQYIHRTGKIRTVVKTVEKEVVRYVETASKKCILDPSFERMFDRISGVLDGAGDGLPAADTTTGSAVVPAGPLLTDAEVLRAYQFAITEYGEERERYRALSEWVTSTYQLANVR